MSKRCFVCDDLLKLITVPRDYTWKIPFMDIEIIIRYWNGTELICMVCAQEKHEAPLWGAYNAGKTDGYNEGYDHGQEGYDPGQQD